MNARLDVVVEGAQVVRLSGAAPLAAKVLDGADGPELLLVGAAASLLEGDRLVVSVRLGAGAGLTVRTAAATLAHPCPGGGSTAFDVEVDLALGARLAWLPEPLVACGGCRHRGRATLRLAEGAQVMWCETIGLGRSGEEPGDVELRLDADLSGRPLLRDGLRFGPSAAGWDGPAVADGATHLGTVALLGAAGEHDGIGAVLRLAGPGTVVRAGAADGAALAAALLPARQAFLAAMRSVPAGRAGVA